VSTFLSRTSAIVVVAGLSILVLSGCIVPDGGYGYGGVAVGADYYEPYGVDYGGWGPGYQVGPWRGGGGRAVGAGGAAHAYRSAPAGHATPSLPSGGRAGGGGGRSGGGGRR
jgi:hypothetical protein